MERYELAECDAVQTKNTTLNNSLSGTDSTNEWVRCRPPSEGGGSRWTTPIPIVDDRVSSLVARIESQRRQIVDGKVRRQGVENQAGDLQVIAEKCVGQIKLNAEPTGKLGAEVWNLNAMNANEQANGMCQSKAAEISQYSACVAEVSAAECVAALP